jgi:hypothetical protein
LSMTTAPRAIASGASWRLTAAPADASTMSTPSKESAVALVTEMEWPLNLEFYFILIYTNYTFFVTFLKHFIINIF